MKTPAIPFLLWLVTAWVRAHPGHEALRSVPAPATAPEVNISVEGDHRLIRANGIPDHPTGPFPGRGNPNTISAQRHDFRIPARPQPATRPTPLGMSPFGIAVNGVLFDPAAAEWWRDDRASGWQYDALGGGRNLGIDLEHAHVQPTGAYHYHGLPLSLLAKLTGGKEKMALLGWAADGFPVYGPWIPSDATPGSALKRATSSYRKKAGERSGGPGGAHDGAFVEDWEYVAGSGDLDECNGRIGPTPEFPHGTYHYVLTDAFPFLPRMWRGTADASFVRRPGAGGPPAKKKKGAKK
jgi:hypothetical protein